MSTVRASIADRLIGAPVAHEVIDLFQGVLDVVAFDPVDRVHAFAGPAGIHADAANVAGTTQEPESI